MIFFDFTSRCAIAGFCGVPVPCKALCKCSKPQTALKFKALEIRYFSHHFSIYHRPASCNQNFEISISTTYQFYILLLFFGFHPLLKMHHTCKPNVELHSLTGFLHVANIQKENRKHGNP